MEVLTDYNYVNSILDNYNISNSDWYQVHLFLGKYKDDITKSQFIILLLTKSITMYLYKLKTSGYEICMYESCKIFMCWLGFPLYYTQQMLDFMIFTCMKNTQSLCSGNVCRNQACLIVHTNFI